MDLPYAQLLENMRLRKEISESFGILHAVLDCCVQLGIIVDHTATTAADITITDNDNINDNDNNNSNDECNGRSYNSNGIFNFDNICLIDLCSGKGITTALCDALAGVRPLVRKISIRRRRTTTTIKLLSCH